MLLLRCPYRSYILQVLLYLAACLPSPFLAPYHTFLLLLLL
jgi:hypothetical protein